MGESDSERFSVFFGLRFERQQWFHSAVIRRIANRLRPNCLEPWIEHQPDSRRSLISSPRTTLALDAYLTVEGVHFDSPARIREVPKNEVPRRHCTTGWVLYWTTGPAVGLGFFPTEAACKAAGQEAVADGKAAEAKDEADEAVFEREQPDESEGTTIGYDVEWKCRESKPKPQATPPS
jgi:hypothetical protein